jgi:hypothetical protein
VLLLFFFLERRCEVLFLNLLYANGSRAVAGCGLRAASDQAAAEAEIAFDEISPASARTNKFRSLDERCAMKINATPMVENID